MEEPKTEEVINATNNSEKIEEVKNEETTEAPKNWLEEEAAKVNDNAYDGDKKPGLIFEENKTKTLTIGTQEKFRDWTSSDGKTKKIIPCMVGEDEFVWWLNVKNPIYGQIVALAASVYPAPLIVKIMQTGKNDKTQYHIVEED